MIVLVSISPKLERPKWLRAPAPVGENYRELKTLIESLNLRRPIYRATAAYGHFGRTGPGFTWEKTDKADAIRKEAGTRGAVAVSRA